ncbi:MAG: hypothetical protein ACI4SG_03590 [Oligosphaeraceae bacterium]
MPAVYQEQRTVQYLAPTRVVWHSPEASHAATLLEVAGETASIWRPMSLTLPPRAGVILEYDTPLPLQGIRISRGRDGFGPARVRVRLGESVTEVLDAPNNDHSMHDFPLLLSAMGVTRAGNTGFRFLHLENLEEEATLQLRECSAEAWVHPAVRLGSFQSSDPLLDRIFQACAATLEKCISPLLLDGTKRDRLVWMGDLYNEVRACGVLYARHSAIPESLEFLNEEALANHYFNGIPSYTAYWFLAQREYQRVYGDKAFLQTQRPAFRVFSSLLLEAYEKEPEQVLKGSIVDWGTQVCCPPDAYGPLYLAAVKACRDMAAMLEEREILGRCLAVEEALTPRLPLENAPKSVWAWAMLAGAVSPEEAFRRLDEKPEEELSTFHFDNFLRVYSAAGESPKALALLRRYYGAMLDLGSRTIWEQFDLPWAANANAIDQMPVPGRTDAHRDCGRGCFQGLRNSLCHGWGASPVAWMMETLAGITPEGEGYAYGVRVKPRLCDLEWLHATCATPRGPVTVRLRKGATPQVEAPQGMPVFVSPEPL